MHGRNVIPHGRRIVNPAGISPKLFQYPCWISTEDPETEGLRRNVTLQLQVVLGWAGLPGTGRAYLQNLGKRVFER